MTSREFDKEGIDSNNVSPSNRGVVAAYALAADEEDEDEQLKVKSIREFGMDDLPRWAYRASALEMVPRFAPRSLPLGTVAGAALPFTFCATMLLWSSLITYAVLTERASVCKASGFSHYSLAMPCTFAPILLVCMCIDFYCWQCINIAKFQTLRKYTILGVSIDIRLWLATKAMQSSVRFYQFFSAGAFFGCVFKTLKCDAGAELTRVWDMTMQQSLFGMLPYADKLMPSFSTCIYCTVVFVYVQLLYALMSSIPTRPCDVDYEMCLRSGRKYVTQYETLVHHISHDVQNHGAALMTLAEANGMCMVSADDLAYALRKAEVAFSEHDPGCLRDVLNHPKSQLRKGFQRTFLAGFCWNGLLLNLQVTFFAVEHYHDPHVNKDLVGLIVTVITSSFVIAEGMRIAYHSWLWYCRMSALLERMGNESPDDTRHWQDQLRVFLSWLVALLVVLLLTIMEWAYAGCKLVMAFHCENALWNITGCVDLA